MDIKIRNRNTGEERYLPILKINPIRSEPLILAIEGSNAVNNEEHPFFEFFQIAFVADIYFGQSQSIIGYFYYNHDFELMFYAYDELPDNEFVDSDYLYKVINYEGYLKMCQFTNETPLSLIEYYKRKNQEVLPNSILTYKGKHLNANQVAELYKKFPL